MKEQWQKGFGIIEIFIIVIIVACLGVGGWWLYQKQLHTTTTTTQQSSQADMYAGWKEYKSVVAGYSIKHPSGWTIRTGTNNGGAEQVTVTSPGNFEIRILSFSKSSGYWHQAGSSESCTSSCLSINSSTPISIPNYGTLNIEATTAGVGGGTMNELLLLPSASNMLIASPAKPGIYTTVIGLSQGLTEDQQASMTASQFLALPDVETAKLIYKSLSY